MISLSQLLRYLVVQEWKGENDQGFPRHTCVRVTVVVLCVSVCLSVAASAYVYTWVSLGFCFSWILTRGFSKKPYVQKLWCEKANG